MRKGSSKPCSSSLCRRDFIFLSGILGCGRGRGSGLGAALCPRSAPLPAAPPRDRGHPHCALATVMAGGCPPTLLRATPAVTPPRCLCSPVSPTSSSGGPGDHPSSMPTTQIPPVLTWRGGIVPGPPSRGAGAASWWLFAARRTGASGEAANVPAARAELPIYSAGLVWPAAPIRKANGRVGVIAMSAEDTGGMSS